MKEPKPEDNKTTGPLFPVDNKTARQLFICGQIMGVLARMNRGDDVDPGALDAMLGQVDVDLLQKYVDSKPEGFKYSTQCRHIIQMAKDGKGDN